MWFHVICGSLCDEQFEVLPSLLQEVCTCSRECRQKGEVDWELFLSLQFGAATEILVSFPQTKSHPFMLYFGRFVPGIVSVLLDSPPIPKGLCGTWLSLAAPGRSWRHQLDPYHRSAVPRTRHPHTRSHILIKEIPRLS